MLHSCAWRNLVLRLLGFVYLVAFTSVLIQAPGLYGNSGLLPISKVVDKVAKSDPGILWRARPQEIGVEKWLDLICLGGVMVSLVVCMGWVYAPCMAACWIFYLSINLVGQTFIPFQWDIFLLEVGALAVLYAPGSPLTKSRRPSRVVVLALHWCLFKLMIMSGVVKLQSRCPTWWGLTALHYHYATQCIPTPWAWIAHQMPNFVQKLSVASTFLIEMPGTLLIIAPWREARVLGAYINIFLMILIIATGNYTFFNLLTATLCLTLLEGEPAWWLPAPPEKSEVEQKMQAVVNEVKAQQSNNASSVLHSEQHRRALQRGAQQGRAGGAQGAGATEDPQAPLLWRLAVWSAGVLWLLAAFRAMFEVSERGAGAGNLPGDAAAAWDYLEYTADVRVRFSAEDSEGWVRLLVTWAVPMFLLRLGLEAWVDCASASAPASLLASPLAHSFLAEHRTPAGDGAPEPRRRGVVAHGWWWGNFVAVAGLSACYFFASLSPLTQICPALASVRPLLSEDLYARARPWFLVSGYGLFRRMTGVGQTSAVLPNSGGASIAKVARPELELQGSDDGKTWQPLDFRFKPGNASDPPAWVGFPGFPGTFSGMHQPRLDWQMWFAALGSYQQNPWLLALVLQLLRGSAETKALMATEKWPNGWGDGKKAPQQIRIIKYEYDFSRLNSTDASNGKWWSRKRVGEYLPALTKDHPGLVDFQKQLGLDRPLDSKERGTATGLTKLLKEVAEGLRPHREAVVQGAMGAALLLLSFNFLAALLPRRRRGRTGSIGRSSEAAHLKAD